VDSTHSASSGQAGSPQVESGFDRLKGGKCTLYIHTDFRDDIFEQTLLAGKEELHKRYHTTAVRSSKFTSMCKFIVRFGDVERVIYFKEYFFRSTWDFVKHLFRSSRARRALKAALMLAENGFESPAIVAMGQCRFVFFTIRNFVATLGVENGRSVYQIIADKQYGPNTGQFQMKRSLAGSFGRTIGRMHAEGIFHGDLRLGNVLARKELDGWRFFFLDNERTKKFRRLPARLRLKNLVQINMFEPWLASNTDRMRFFKEYWAENKRSKVGKTSLIKKVLKKTRRRLKKKQVLKL
jgi:tRNA A-37 threonylcarbamoyl transferase component Bud32